MVAETFAGLRDELAAEWEAGKRAVSRGSSRGSVDEDENAASEGGAETSEIAGEIAKRANGLEPSTFSLGSKRPLSAEGGNAENVGDLTSGMGANGDEK